MTKYYYIDLCDDDAVEEYKDEAEFFEGMLWNRDIAEEYGDKVRSKAAVRRDFKRNDDFYEEFNGAGFLKATKTNVEDYL